MSTTDATLAPQASPAPHAARTPARSFGRRTRDVLGLAWLHGSLRAAVYRKQTMTASWESPAAVQTLEEFEPALDAAIAALGFAGSEVFLVLEHDRFSHQSEQAPAFSDTAARAYLRARVERYEKDHEPVLWVSQRTVSARKEAAFLLHLLPSAFYGRLNSLLLARRLDLTRILPLVVPLQMMLETFSVPKDQPVLIAADAGETTTVLVARADGQLLFSRTMLARWDTDPARLGVEVNRSVLYAKQQFGAIVDRLWLLGPSAEQARAEVQARCGASKEVLVHTSTTFEWLQAVARLSPRHPVNLVAGYIARKRRHQLIRRAVVAACWLGFGLLSLDGWSRVQTLHAERQRMTGLQANEATLRSDRERLQARNAVADGHREFVRQAAEERVPPVPARLLAFLSSALPAEASLSECSVKHDPANGEWSFRLEGVFEGDEETVRESLAAFQRTLAKSPLRVRFNESVRSLVSMPGVAGEAPSSHRFVLEGVLFEG